jgi:hypothetical protein
MFLLYMSREIAQATILFGTDRALSHVPLLPMHDDLQCRCSVRRSAKACPPQLAHLHTPSAWCIDRSHLVVGSFYAHRLLGVAPVPSSPRPSLGLSS